MKKHQVLYGIIILLVAFIGYHYWKMNKAEA